MKKFVIIDLSKDVDLTVNNAQIFQLSCGITKLKNSTLLNKKFFSEKKFKKFREKVNTLLFNFYNYLKTDKSKNDLIHSVVSKGYKLNLKDGTTNFIKKALVKVYEYKNESVENENKNI